MLIIKNDIKNLIAKDMCCIYVELFIDETYALALEICPLLRFVDMKIYKLYLEDQML